MTEKHPVVTPQPSPYPTLIIKYALIAVYGAASGYVGVATLDAVAGTGWALLWPALIMVTATASLVGVLIERAGGSAWPEMVATIAMLSLLGGYSIAIVIRSVEDGTLTRLPFAMLPVILSVFPASRLGGLARKTVKR
jgi:hypothetical protein